MIIPIAQCSCSIWNETIYFAFECMGRRTALIYPRSYCNIIILYFVYVSTPGYDLLLARIQGILQASVFYIFKSLMFSTATGVGWKPNQEDYTLTNPTIIQIIKRTKGGTSTAKRPSAPTRPTDLITACRYHGPTQLQLQHPAQTAYSILLSRNPSLHLHLHLHLHSSHAA